MAVAPLWSKLPLQSLVIALTLKVVGSFSLRPSNGQSMFATMICRPDPEGTCDKSNLSATRTAPEPSLASIVACEGERARTSADADWNESMTRAAKIRMFFIVHLLIGPPKVWSFVQDLLQQRLGRSKDHSPRLFLYRHSRPRARHDCRPQVPRSRGSG